MIEKEFNLKYAKFQFEKRLIALELAKNELKGRKRESTSDADEMINLAKRYLQFLEN